WDTAKLGNAQTHPDAGGWDCRRGVTFLESGRMLVAAWKIDDKKVRIWEGIKAKDPRLLEGQEDGTNGFAFSSDGKTLASASPSGTARLWDVATGRGIHTLQGFREAGQARADGNYEGVFSLAFSPDGNTLALGGSGSTIGLWSRATGKELLRLAGLHRSVDALAFSPDGKTLAAGYYDDRICFWEVASGKIR